MAAASQAKINMKKSFMNNIKSFVDSNVRQRIDRSHGVANHDILTYELSAIERQYEDLRKLCIDAEKRISTLLQTLNTSNNPCTIPDGQPESSKSDNRPMSTDNTTKRSQNLNLYQAYISSKTKGFDNPILGRLDDKHSNILFRSKKLPMVRFLKFLTRSSHRSKSDSLLALTLSHCSQLQAQLTTLYITYEQAVESQCLRPIESIIENDLPTIMRAKKAFIKSHNDLEAVRAKFNSASQKQISLQNQRQNTQQNMNNFSGTSYNIQQTSAQQANTVKLDILQKELDEAESRFEQSKVSLIVAKRYKVWQIFISMRFK